MAAPAPASARVTVRSPDGTIGSVPASDLAAAIDAGAEELSPEAVRSARLEEDYGGLGGSAAAAGLGGLRGLTAGLSDPAIVAVGGERARRGLANYQEANPLASGVGEAVGTVAPLLATAGTGAVARGVAKAGALPRLASGLGGAVERGTLAALGEGTTVAGRMGRAAVGSALGGAAEGALYGAGHAVSEATLGDHELTAEQVMADAGAAALFGGVLSGASQLPVSAAGEVLRGGRALVGRGVTALEGASQRAGSRLRELGADATDAARTLEAGARRVVADGERAAARAVADAPGFVQRVDDAASSLLPTSKELERMSDEQAWRSTYARKKFTEEADKRAGGVANVGKTLKELRVIDEQAGVAGNLAGPQELLPKIEAARETVGRRIGEIADTSKATVKVGKIVEDVEAVINPLREIAGRESVVASLEGYRDSLIRQLDGFSPKGKLLIGKSVPVQSLRKQRIGLQDIAFREAKSLDPQARVEFLREIRGALDGIEVNAMVASGADAAEIATLKRQFQHLRIAEDATTDAISRMGANRSIGATDYLAFVAGGAGVTGATLAIANKIGREKGSAAVSVFLADLAKTRSIAASAKKVGVDVGGRASAALGGLQAQPVVQSAVAALSAAKARVEQQVSAGVKGFLASAQDAARGVEAQASSVASRAGQVAAEAGRTAAAAGRAVGTVARVARTARQAGYVDVFAQSREYEARRRETERMALHVADLARRPELLQAEIGRIVGGSANDAPNTSIAMASAAARASAALAARAPKPRSSGASLAPHLERARFDDAAIRKFARQLEGVRRPLSLLEDLRDGNVSRDKVEVVREVYPKLFGQIQEQIMTAVASADAPPPTELAVRLGSMFDVPTHWSLEPGATAALQQGFQAAPAGSDVAPDAAVKSGPARPLRGQIADKTATESERVEEGSA